MHIYVQLCFKQKKQWRRCYAKWRRATPQPDEKLEKQWRCCYAIWRRTDQEIPLRLMRFYEPYGNHPGNRVPINRPILAIRFQIGTYDLLTVLVSFWSIKTLKVFALEVKLTLPPCSPWPVKLWNPSSAIRSFSPLAPRTRVFEWVSPLDRIASVNTSGFVRVNLWQSGP